MKIFWRRIYPVVGYGGGIQRNSSIKDNQERRFIFLRSRSSSSISGGTHKVKFGSW
jgi:hypothetical protein